MPITGPTGSGGGGASAYGLGPTPNTFANDAARDTQAADATWLGQYNDNRFFWIRNGSDIQRRNAAGDAWENVTAVVQGPAGADGDDATQVVANPAGTGGDALTRITIGTTSYNIEGSGGGDAATWDRRLNPTIASLGWKSNARDGVDFNTATPRSFTTNGSAPSRYIGIELPDDMRYAIRNSQLGLSIRLFVRVRCITSTTPVMLRFVLYDGETSFTAISQQDHSFPMNIEGSATGYAVLDLPAGTNIGTSGNIYIRVIWRSSPGSNTVTVDMHEITASIHDSSGLTAVAPADLTGISTATAGRLIAVGTNTGQFQEIDPSSIGGGFDIWTGASSARNVLANADRIPFAYAAGSGEPNRHITYENLLAGIKSALIQPGITRYEVTGAQRVEADTNIGETTYRYSVELSQTAHVAAARIVGFAGTDRVPAARTALATLTDYAHSSGEVQLPANTMLAANAVYTLRLEVYETGQTVGTSTPIAYQDFRITGQATSSQTHFGAITSTEAAADIVFADDDITARHGVAGNWTVSGLTSGSMWRLYWAVPADDPQPVRWSQSGFNLTPTIETAVDRTIDSVMYKIYLLAAANAVTDAFNSEVIEVTT